MFESLLAELRQWKMDDSWICSYCGLGAVDDPSLSKFVCVQCADEFVFCAECFFETHRKYMGDEDAKIQRAAAERKSTNITKLKRKKEKEEAERIAREEATKIASVPSASLEASPITSSSGPQLVSMSNTTSPSPTQPRRALSPSSPPPPPHQRPTSPERALSPTPRPVKLTSPRLSSPRLDYEGDGYYGSYGYDLGSGSGGYGRPYGSGYGSGSGGYGRPYGRSYGGLNGFGGSYMGLHDSGATRKSMNAGFKGAVNGVLSPVSGAVDHLSSGARPKRAGSLALSPPVSPPPGPAANSPLKSPLDVEELKKRRSHMLRHFECVPSVLEGK